MAQPTTHHQHETTRVEPRFTRRMLAKAAAGFAAATAFASAAPAAKPAVAQESTTRGSEWWAPEGAGAAGESIELAADHAFRAIAPHWTADPSIEGAV